MVYYCVVDGLQLDLEQMMNQKDKAVTGLTSGIAALFKANKVYCPVYIIGSHGNCSGITCTRTWKDQWT